MMKSEKKLTQTQSAYKRLKQAIVGGELKPGSPILETEFSDFLGMSRTPVHEAIKQLQGEGYLDIVPKKGAFVKQITLEDLIMGYETLEGLEGMSAYLVAEHCASSVLQEKDLKELEFLIDSMDKAEKDNNISSWVEYDTKFHSSLYKLSTNNILIENIKRLENQFTYVSMNITPLYVNRKIANQEHREILGAIRNGNCDEARRSAQAQRHRIRDKLRECSQLLLLR